MGCTNTHFTNPNGLHDDDHYTTAYDMARIARLAYTNEKFRSLIQEPTYVIEKTNKKEEPIEMIQQHKMYMVRNIPMKDAGEVRPDLLRRHRVHWSLMRREMVCGLSV